MGKWKLGQHFKSKSVTQNSTSREKTTLVFIEELNIFPRRVVFLLAHLRNFVNCFFKLLKAKTGLVFNTSNTNADSENKIFGDPLETIWKNCIFDFCGVKQFDRKIFRIIPLY
jgi:hypothetical protein